MFCQDRSQLWGIRGKCLGKYLPPNIPNNVLYVAQYGGIFLVEGGVWSVAGGGGGTERGVSPLPLVEEMEVRKCLDDFWSTPQSVFGKAILYIDIDKTYFQLQNYKKNRSSFCWKGGARLYPPPPRIRHCIRITQCLDIFPTPIYGPVCIKSVTAMIQNSIGWQQNSNKGMPKPTTTKLFPFVYLAVANRRKRTPHCAHGRLGYQWGMGSHRGSHVLYIILYQHCTWSRAMFWKTARLSNTHRHNTYMYMYILSDMLFTQTQHVHLFRHVVYTDIVSWEQ